MPPSISRSPSSGLAVIGNRRLTGQLFNDIVGLMNESRGLGKDGRFAAPKPGNLGQANDELNDIPRGEVAGGIQGWPPCSPANRHTQGGPQRFPRVAQRNQGAKSCQLQSLPTMPARQIVFCRALRSCLADRTPPCLVSLFVATAAGEVGPKATEVVHRRLSSYRHRPHTTGTHVDAKVRRRVHFSRESRLQIR